MATECDRGEEATAYVLGELEGAELSAFKRHLRGCSICADEVELLESAVHAVPLLATPQAPREQPPVSERAAAALRLQQATQQRPRLRAIVGGAAGAQGGGQAGDGDSEETGFGQPRPRPRRQGVIPASAKFAVGALCLLALVIVVLIRAQHDGSKAPVSYLRAEAGWSGGGAVVKVQGTQAELLVVGMPAPRRGTYYEVWLRYKHSSHLTATSAKVRLNLAGEAGVGIPADIDNAIVLAVYREPTGGRRTTNSGAVVVADLRPATEPSSGLTTVSLTP